MTKKIKNDDENFAHIRMSMERSMGGAVPKIGSQKEFEAQDLYYEAMETGDSDLILQALEIDPGNADCLLQVLYMLDSSEGEALEFSRHIVKTAEKRLGKKIFEECKGHFWSMLETRPYMRARNDLAIRLSDADQVEEAMTEYEGMLELCPGDNMGIRYVLLGLYFQEARLEDAGRLLKEFEDERPYSAVMAWGYVLERYLAGELTEAKKALNVARKTNGFAEAYLKGHRKLPKNSPGSYSPGSREEAQICADLQQTAWNKYPLAQAWLEAQKPAAK